MEQPIDWVFVATTSMSFYMALSMLNDAKLWTGKGFTKFMGLILVCVGCVIKNTDETFSTMCWCIGAILLASSVQD